jgi:ATP-dependent protease ClpP protease subunit
MPTNKLLCLLKNNSNKGSFKAEDNTIYLYDMIVSSDEEADFWGGVSAESFVAALKGMSGPVALRINSPGGDVFGARVMQQAMAEYPDQITAHVDGLAASAATFLTSAADKTVMAEGSMLMVHKAWSIALGNADDFMHQASILEKLDKTIADTYVASAESRGKKAADFAAMMTEETWLTAAEAIDLGLADEEVKSKKSGKKAMAHWDLSAFAKAPAIDPDEEDEFDESQEDQQIVVNEIERRRRNADAVLKTAA